MMYKIVLESINLAPSYRLGYPHTHLTDPLPSWILIFIPYSVSAVNSIYYYNYHWYSTTEMRPCFSGSEAPPLVASATPSRVQADRPGIQVAAGLNPAVSGERMPSHRQRSCRCHLRSVEANVCIVPKTTIRSDDRSFCVAGPRFWNIQHSATV